MTPEERKAWTVALVRAKIMGWSWKTVACWLYYTFDEPHGQTRYESYPVHRVKHMQGFLSNEKLRGNNTGDLEYDGRTNIQRRYPDEVSCNLEGQGVE